MARQQHPVALHTHCTHRAAAALPPHLPSTTAHLVAAQNQLSQDKRPHSRVWEVGHPKDTRLWWWRGEGAMDEGGNGNPEPTAGQSQLGPSRDPHRSKSLPPALGRFPRMGLSCSLGCRKGVFPDTAQGIRSSRRQFLAGSWPGITGLCPDLQGSRLS